MKKVKQEPVYLTPSSKAMLTSIDFSDTFATTNHKNSMDELNNLIFGRIPKWLLTLFKLRNKIVKWLNLAIETPVLNEGKASVQFFKTYDVRENQIVIGANDHHLNFRAVIHNTKSKNYNIKVTTLVQYNNRLGKVYMTIIKPFHVFVVKQMVKQAYIQ